jgi:hypothetical protein
MTTNLSTAAQQVSHFNEGAYSGLQCSWFREMLITLEGQGTTFLDLSLEAHHSWPNGIFQNSRYLQLVVRDGAVQCISKSYRLPTFRKCKASTPEQVVRVVNRYLDRVSELEA